MELQDIKTVKEAEAYITLKSIKYPSKEEEIKDTFRCMYLIQNDLWVNDSKAGKIGYKPYPPSAHSLQPLKYHALSLVTQDIELKPWAIDSVELSVYFYFKFIDLLRKFNLKIEEPILRKLSYSVGFNAFNRDWVIPFPKLFEEKLCKRYSFWETPLHDQSIKARKEYVDEWLSSTEVITYLTLLSTNIPYTHESLQQLLNSSNEECKIEYQERVWEKRYEDKEITEALRLLADQEHIKVESIMMSNFDFILNKDENLFYISPNKYLERIDS